ncbi:MAG: calcium-binding protein, partial [Methylococcales bacterium]|nr:calcium-binding protein [Methylococcales bacterium]
TGLAGSDTLSGGLGNDFIDGGVVNDLLSGENGDDTLIGGDGKDTINGGSGNDKLDGGKDNDKLSGDAGNDTLNGGAGADTMTGGDGSDYYFVDNLKDFITESNKVVTTGGNDTVESVLLNYTLPANVENLILGGIEISNGTGNKADNVITGNLADNYLRGDAGNDKLVGNAGVDTLDGGLGMDTLIGGEDSDVYFMNNTEDTIIETENGGDLDQVNATVSFSLSSAPNVEALELSGEKATDGTGNELNNLIQEKEGGTVANSLSGMAGDDTLDGAGGDDTLEGGEGNDILEGGDGTDTAIYNDLQKNYQITANVDSTGVAQLVVKYVGNTDNGAIDEGEDILSDIEILQFSDGSTINAADVISGNLDNTVDGGNDTINSDSSIDTVSEGLGNDTISGGSDNNAQGLPKDTRTYDLELSLSDDANTLDGSPANEKILGLGGADTLNGKEGNDYLDGGAGDDSLIGGVGDDYLLGGDGNDSISGDNGNDSIDGGNGNNVITDSNGNNFIVTGTGNDSISGAGNINSGAGNDDITGSPYATTNTVHGGDGNDSIRVHLYDDYITYSVPHDYSLLYGDAGNDMITGNVSTYQKSDCSLYGGDGNDTLAGGVYLEGDAGNDTLIGKTASIGYETFIGGLDVDTIRTAGGKDIIEYDKITDSGVGAGNRDIITDFDTSSGAVIDLYRLLDSALTFEGMKAFDGTKGAVRFNVDAVKSQTIVQVDMNGDKTPEMEIELTGIKILAADDFVLVKGA